MRIIWVPGHVAVTGNDKADALARLARACLNVDIHLNKTLSDCYNTIKKLILNEWQVQWDVDPVILHYHMVQPVVGRKWKFSDENKHMEKCISRLRLSKCILNSFMHKINIHPTELCDSYGVDEDHYLMECIDQSALRSTLQITIHNNLRIK